MEVTQTDKAITLDCGCNVPITLTFQRGELDAVQGSLNFCNLHASAPALLEALELAVRYLEHPDVTALPFALPVTNASRMAHAAIEAAKGEK